MAKNVQTFAYPLAQLTWTAGSGDTVEFKKLPVSRWGRIVHLTGISFEMTLTPTYTTAPTVAGLNNMVSRIEIHDGHQVRFLGSMNALRSKERIENGKPLFSEPTVNAGSTNPRYWARYWSAGPQLFAGNPSDFMLPTAVMQNGSLKLTYGAVTDISADTTTATTGTIRVTAHLAVYDEIRVPPFYEWREIPVGTANNDLAGNVLYAFVALANSTAYGAIGANAFGTISAELGSGQIVPGVDAEILNRCYHADMRSGMFGGLQGEPRNATYDTNERTVNLTGGTAIAAQDADLQMVIWSPPDMLLTKLIAPAEGNFNLTWNGSNTAAAILVGRFFKQENSVIATYADDALATLKRKDGGISVKTLSKKPYDKGPRRPYLPYVVKVA